ncbi:MAG: peptide-methionine (R)-S-oxide reductase MsrB, partial [Planctomycetaceae bacterium]
GRIARAFGVRVTPGATLRNPQRGQPPISRKVTLAGRVFAVDRAGKITCNKPRITTLNEMPVVFGQLTQDFWSNREDKQPQWIPQLDRDWRRVLSRTQFLVTRKKQTEPKFSGRYCNTKTPGSYRCVGCGQVVFESTTKYTSGTGWPSFWNAADRKRLHWSRDNSRGTVRIEVQCNRCNAHLGHVFPDGPPPTGQRYCINSAALVLDRTTPPAKPGLPGNNN